MSLNFGNYQPETFGWSKTEGNNQPFAYKGVAIAGGLNYAPGFTTLVKLLLDELVPKIEGGLVSGWCWGGTTEDKAPDSFHLYAIAFDLNAPVNPMSSTPPNFGKMYVLPSNTGDIVRKYGFEWGGNWDASTPPDYMHLEFAGSPDEIPHILEQLGHRPTPSPTPHPAPHGDYPLPPGYYFGPLSGPAQSISGMYATDTNAERDAIKSIQNVVHVATDGAYGPRTEAAVKSYQATHGLANDGLVGPQTWAKMGL